MRHISLIASALIFIVVHTSVFAIKIENGLAKTPPMGFNTWNWFACGGGHGQINEALIRGIADAMVTSGMKDIGYRYIVIDDCWQVSRNAQGNIVAAPDRFPSGMKALADYVHGKGLKFGLYTSRGDRTCQGYPGSAGYEQKDATQYAAWGVDFVKADGCGGNQQEPIKMGSALFATGRPIVLSVNTWGYRNYPDSCGNMWRITGDIAPNFSSVLQVLDVDAPLWPLARPGYWNDADMMQVGNGMPVNEDRAHFSLWCILAAPLIAGNDLRSMTTNTRTILTNAEAIAVDQDSLGKQGRRVIKNGNLEVWAKPMKDSSKAVVLLNRGTTAATISFNWTDVWLKSTDECSIRDLWAHRDLEKKTGSYSASVPGHDVIMLRLYPPYATKTIQNKKPEIQKIGLLRNPNQLKTWPAQSGIRQISLFTPSGTLLKSGFNTNETGRIGSGIILARVQMESGVCVIPILNNHR